MVVRRCLFVYVCDYVMLLCLAIIDVLLFGVRFVVGYRVLFVCCVCCRCVSLSFELLCFVMCCSLFVCAVCS